MQEGRSARRQTASSRSSSRDPTEEIPAIPLIFAISATIERFDEVVAKTPAA